MAVKNVVAKRWTGLRVSGGRYYSAPDLYTPTLPQADVDVTYSLPTGNTWTATNTADNNAAGTGTGNRTGCGLQYAVNNCARGDIIETTGGATYTIQLLLKYKATGSGWIYIRPSTYASLPAVGSRVAAADAANMAKLIGAAANTATIITENYVGYYRIIGHEITTSSTTASPLQSSVCNIRNADTSHSTVCNHIIFDRCYVHGSADGAHSGRRGFWMDGENLAVIDSRVSGFYDDGSDSQAILVAQGNGPFKFDNNYLEGASENINFGGVDPTISNSVPQDITFTRNHCFKPLSWIGAGHNVKNSFETKNSRRLLVEGNVFENCWADGQTGMSLLLTPRNQDGTATWCGVFDTTIRKNKFINCAGGINILGIDATHAPDYSQRVDRVLIENNLGEVMDPSTGADHRVLQTLSGPEYITYRHNTWLNAYTGGATLYPGNAGAAPAQKGLGLVFQDNILGFGEYGYIQGVQGTACLDAQFDSHTATYNALIGKTGATPYPASTFAPANIAAVGFTDTAGSFADNDYTLTVGSTYHNAASDGTDLGCDIAALNAAIAGVRI